MLKVWQRRQTVGCGEFNGGGIAAETRTHQGDQQIPERHRRRIGERQRGAVDEAEECQHRGGERIKRGAIELAVDDERGDGPQHQSRQCAATAEQLQAMVDHAVAGKLVEADLRRRSTRRG